MKSKEKTKEQKKKKKEYSKQTLHCTIDIDTINTLLNVHSTTEFINIESLFVVTLSHISFI
jgi:hypothetical protein